MILKGAVAQLGERLNGIQEVVGSIPISSTIEYHCMGTSLLITISIGGTLFRMTSESSVSMILWLQNAAT